MTDKKDDRKTDDGTAGPRPHGLRQGEVIDGEDLSNRAKWLSDVKVKVVQPEKRDEPEGMSHAHTKG